MKWTIAMGYTFVLALMFLYEWPKINRNQKKDKKVYVTLLAMGWVLAMVLLFFPETPGPTYLVKRILNPLGKLLE